jgi:hypothetical protein
MGTADLSKRTHWLLRLAALAVIAAAAWLPRGGSVVAARAASLGAADAQAIHASVARR